MAVKTFDLHTHLLEKEVKPEVYWRAVAKKGIDVVAITEHIEEKPRLAYELLLEKKPRGKTLIPGMELNTEIGHVVAYGSNAEIYEIGEFLKKGLKIKRALKLAEKNGAILSIAHPWGFSYDSATYIAGEKKIEKIVEENYIGVEAFNGLMGTLGNFVYDTNWVKRPLNFLDYLERNRVARKTRIDRIGKRLKEKLDSKSREVIERCAKPIQLGEKASFVTAGSDAHYPARIGTGIMKVKVMKGGMKKAMLLEAIQDKKNVEWVGPYVEERSDGSYKVNVKPMSRSEAIQGIRYATISTGKEKLSSLGSKIRKRIKRRNKK